MKKGLMLLLVSVILLILFPIESRASGSNDTVNAWNQTKYASDINMEYKGTWQCAAYVQYAFFYKYGHSYEQGDPNSIVSPFTVTSGKEIEQLIKEYAVAGDAIRISLFQNGVESKTKNTHIFILESFDDGEINVSESNFSNDGRNTARTYAYSNGDTLLEYCCGQKTGTFLLKIIHSKFNVNGNGEKVIRLWDINSGDTINGEKKLWAKRNDNDSNHYAVFYLDGQAITGHLSADSDGFFSCIVDNSDYAEGAHTLTIKYVNTTSSWSDTISLNFVNSKTIQLWDINSGDTINGVKKLWAKRTDGDSNHYAVFYLDGEAITGHLSADSDGFFSCIVDSSAYAEGTHTLSIKYVNTTSSCNDTITLNFVNPKKYKLSGTITSFGDKSKNSTLKLLDVNGVVVAETSVKGNNTQYTLENILPGTYTMRVSKENHVTREYNLTVKETSLTQDVEIRLLGDIVGDGVLNAKDKKIFYNYIASSMPTDAYDLAVADVNKDGNVNAKDKKLLYNHIAGSNLLW